MPRSASVVGLAKRGVIPRKQFYNNLFFFNTVILVLWLLGFFAFHVAGGLIHLLLIIAVISLVMHFVRGRSAA